ncbi:MAG: VIT and VWA domain-containing protein, partial [bacterium]
MRKAYLKFIGRSLLTLLTFLTLHTFSFATGILIVERPVPPNYLSLRVETYKVHLNLDGPIAKTTVHEVFFNPNNFNVEATYLFPVPPGAAVSNLSILINGKKVEAETLDNIKAHDIYTDIVRKMRDPALLEYVDGALFRLRLFPIPANGRQEVELQFSQVLAQEGGLARYRYPLHLDPGSLAMFHECRDFCITFEATAAQPIKTLYSPSHSLDITERTERSAKGSVEGLVFNDNRDFALYIGTDTKSVSASILTYRPSPEEPGSFLLFLSPDLRPPDSEVTPRAITFVLDNSGSMADEDKLGSAVRALKRGLHGLNSRDAFRLLRFSTEVEALVPEFTSPTESALKSAESQLDKLRPSGSTNIGDALRSALATPDPAGRLRVIVFLTDGRPTVGDIDLSSLINILANNTSDPSRLSDLSNPSHLPATAKPSGEAGSHPSHPSHLSHLSSPRLFIIGIGSDVNARLLDALASESRGASEYLRAGDDLEIALAGFFEKINSPVLTGLSLQSDGIELFDYYPNPLPDLFAGQTLTVAGRFKSEKKTDVASESKSSSIEDDPSHPSDLSHLSHPPATAKPSGEAGSYSSDPSNLSHPSYSSSLHLTLSGNVEGKISNFKFEIALGGDENANPFVETLWAQRKVGYLLEQLRQHGDTPEVRDEVTQLAKKHGIVTPFTSFLAHEDNEQLAAVRPPTGRTTSGPPPNIGNVPNVIVGDASDSQGSPDNNYFRFPNAINFLQYAQDNNTPTTAIRWKFMEADKPGNVSQFGGVVDGLAGRTPAPLALHSSEGREGVAVAQ